MKYMIVSTIEVEGSRELAEEVVDIVEDFLLSDLHYITQSTTRILTEEEYLKEMDNDN